MAVDPATLERLSAAFLEALRPSPDTNLDARRSIEYQLAQFRDLLPEPHAWAALGSGDNAALVLLADDALLTISRADAIDAERGLTVTCHQARVTEVTCQRDEQRTSWNFHFRDRAPLQIEGRINHSSDPDADEAFDRAEAFAYVLAGRAGWPITEQWSVRDLEPHDDDHHGADPPLSLRKREPVTDLWGNPRPKRTKR